jgi:hypothetical protein
MPVSSFSSFSIRSLITTARLSRIHASEQEETEQTEAEERSKAPVSGDAMRSLNGDHARFGLILRILASVLCFLCYLLFPTESFRMS